MTTLKKFYDKIQSEGGRCLLIGGAVIDELKNLPIKDWDFEIYYLQLDNIIQILKDLELPIKEVGKSFGVIKTVIEGLDIDISIPRTENKIGIGHKGFSINLNPNMSPKEAGRRRDLTINSMYKDMHTGNIIDPFNGLQDLHNGIIRATDPKTFIEDPLRVLRIMQLLPRKGKIVHAHTTMLCHNIVDSFKELPKERIFNEFEKLLLKADRPSMGLEFLRQCDWIRHFPELKDLIGCEQNPKWHPEGDVWTHTLMVLDNAAKLRHLVPEEYKLTFMFAALLHDIGKPSTTTEDLRSPGHDTAGIPLAITFLERMTNNLFLLENVPKLVGLHMRAGQLASANSKISAWKRLHNKFRLDILGFLSKADSAGRTGRSLDDKHIPSELCFKYFNAFPIKIEPILQGRDLIDKGMKPSKEFGIILKKAYELQIEGVTDKEELLRLLKI